MKKKWNPFINESMDQLELIEFDLSESAPIKIRKDSLLVEVEGIHVTTTRNLHDYTAEALKSCIKSWTVPYRRPVLMHHDEKGGKIIGRVLSVEYTEHNTFSGTGALVFTIHVPDEQGKQQILDGLLETVSIGVIVKRAHCSICGQDLAVEGLCEHEKGEYYNGKQCRWVIDQMEAKEISYVHVPSDKFAKNRKYYYPDQASSSFKITESFDPENKKGEQNNMTLEEALAAKEEAEKKLAKAEENLRKAEEENGTLKTQVAEATAAAEAVKSEKETLATAEAATKTELEATKTELTATKAELEAAQESINEEKTLKEAAEASLAEKITAAKESMVDTVVKLRKAAGKGEEVTVDALKERSEDSLKDAVTDLIEEITVSKQFVPGSVTNPSLSVEENLSNTDGKNKKADRNISLKEQVEDIFNDVVRARR